MSQIEQDFRHFLSKSPEIEKSYQLGLINRRSLARHLIKKGIVKGNQMDAVIAMLRRFPFRNFPKSVKDHFKGAKITLKDGILILDFEKSKDLLHKLQRLIASTDYDKGDTLKIVVGSASITLFLDDKNEKKVEEFLDQHSLRNKYKSVSEVSILFSHKVTQEPGVISILSRELSLYDIVILELLTASEELLLYVKEDAVMKAYEIIKELQH